MRKFDFGSFMVGLLFGLVLSLIWFLDVMSKADCFK
jgi:hypothetical protein